MPPHRGGGRPAQHPAHPRRGGDDRAAHRARGARRVARRQRGLAMRPGRGPDRDGPGRGQPDPRLLLQMGARVEGIGSNVLIIHGREQLGGADYRIGPDYIEIGSFVALAAVTGGDLRVRDTVPEDLRMTRLVFERLGCRMEFEAGDVVVPAGQRLRVRDDEGDAISKIEDGAWPAFPGELTSLALALATPSEGLGLVFEKMFEKRLFFVGELVY